MFLDNKNYAAFSFSLGITIMTAFGAVLLKLGAADFQVSISGTLFNYYLILGLSLYFFAMILFNIGLSKIDLSVLHPMVSLQYIWITLFGIIIFNEIIDTNRIIGISFIILGSNLLSR